VELSGTDQARDFTLGIDGMLRFQGRLYVSVDDVLKGMILEEGYKSHLSLHPSTTKMYQDLKNSFFGGQV